MIVSLKKYKYFAVSMIFILSIFSYLMYQIHQPEEISPPVILPRSHPLVSPLVQPPLTYFPSLSIPKLEELKAKTADWQVYKNKNYMINIKYPDSWAYEDESNSVIFRAGAELADYNAPMFFSTNKPFAKSGEEITDVTGGASIGIFSSKDFSKIPTKESIANNFKEKKYNEIKTFSLNGFEGAIAITDAEEGRGQQGLVFRILDNHVYYINWYLYEEYQYSKADYSDITYQNQFLPFLASFEIKN